MLEYVILVWSPRESNILFYFILIIIIKIQDKIQDTRCILLTTSTTEYSTFSLVARQRFWYLL